MQSKLKKRLRAAFDESLPRMLLDFQQTRCEGLIPGERVYRRVLPSGVAIFAFLLESPKDDKFTLEGAVAPTDRFPAYCSLMNPREVRMPDGTVHPADRMRNGQLRARAGSFGDVYEDIWWPVDVDSIDRATGIALAFYRDRMLPVLMSLAEGSSR